MKFSDKAQIFTLGKFLILMAMLLLAGSSLFEPAQAQQQPDPRFGAVENFWVPEEAAELGLGNERILFYWKEIQPAGPDDWNTLHVREEWLREAEAQGQTIVGLLKNTPQWATDGPLDAGLPRGLYLPIDDPDNLWAQYVRKIAQYYSVRGVHDWIIWNEPEIEAGVYGHEFDGTVDDYARLLKVASIVMKQEDPDAVIHLAGLTWWHDPTYLGSLLETITADPEAAQHDYYYDAVSLHIYFRTETVATIVDEVEQIQNGAGLNKPIWINETNASPNLDPEWPVERPNFQVDLDQQAWFIIQAHALGFASGASHISVYKLLDIHIAPGGESFGILRPDKSRRPAFYALQNVIALMGGFTSVGIESTEQYHLVTMNRPQGVTRIAWARTAEDIELSLPRLGDEMQLFDAVGDILPVEVAAEGMVNVGLAGARCEPAGCHIGGAPIFIVESNAVAPNLTVVVPATATPTATSTATSTAFAIELPQSTPTALPTLTATVERPTNTPRPDSIVVTAVPTIATATPANQPQTAFGLNPIGVAIVLLAILVGAALLTVAWRRNNGSR